MAGQAPICGVVLTLVNDVPSRYALFRRVSSALHLDIFDQPWNFPAGIFRTPDEMEEIGNLLNLQRPPGLHPNAGAAILNKPQRRLFMKTRVQEVLNMVRPALQADGGDVELVDVSDDGVVSVRLTGACGSCPMSTMTLKMGIERTLKEKVPEVKEVVQV
jgi:Fe-S cluster biogenesis protein NfuA